MAPSIPSPKTTDQSLPAARRDSKGDVPAAKRPTALPKSAVTQPVEHKKASHRSSKPIINWFQRKLAGGSSLSRPTSIPLRVTNRISSAPSPNPNGRQLSKLEAARRKTISLNEEDDGELYANDLASEHFARLDLVSGDAPPSPSPAPSSSSYVSDPRTFRSTAASTKPTTLLSIDLNGNGMAHIAQAPAAPINRLHVRSSSINTTSAVVGSGASITFSALPPSPVSVDATPPLHTTHHPRNNPRPSSPPLDNASVLTLASSAYAMPSRAGVNTPGWSSAPPSALNESLSHFGGSITYADAESTSQYLLGEDDVDASVRAVAAQELTAGQLGKRGESVECACSTGWRGHAVDDARWTELMDVQ
ncbi:hypothetical protein DFH06DRAFT_1322383 [Mycena polygramma]|nr:hypothetical protein DFH06DRAFT_1322383 [Mycena polygramma]